MPHLTVKESINAHYMRAVWHDPILCMGYFFWKYNSTRTATILWK